MSAYAAIGSQTPAAADTILSLSSQGNARLHIYDILIGCIASADTAEQIRIQRATSVETTGAGTSVTPRPLDPDAAQTPEGLAFSNFTTEPTITANSGLIEFAMNQRATIRWVAAGFPLIVPATDEAGIVATFVTGNGASDYSCTMHWYE